MDKSRVIQSFSETVIIIITTDGSNCYKVKCCYGIHCNGLRGLKCTNTVAVFSKALVMKLLKYWSRERERDQHLNNTGWDSLPDIRPEIKLPK